MAGNQGVLGNTDISTDAGILNDVWDQISHSLRIGPAGGGVVTSKAVTFTGAANLGAVGTIPLFTTSGQVLIAIIATCGTTLVGATATIAVGIAGSTARYDPQQTATNITTGKTWDSTGLPAAGTAPVTTPNQASFNAEAIIATVGTAAITAGQLTFYAFWRPLSAGASVVAN